MNVSYIFSPTTVIKSAEVNQNFLDITWQFNDMFQTGIVFWFYGEIGNIPSAYYYCDGNNGTPDLRAKFIRGVGNGLNLGNVAGSEYITIQNQHMPVHHHSVNINTSSNGSHNHTNGAYEKLLSVTGHHTIMNSDDSGGTEPDLWYSESMLPVGDHSHAVNGNTGNSGSGNSINVMNPYVALVPIMVK